VKSEERPKELEMSGVIPVSAMQGGSSTVSTKIHRRNSLITAKKKSLTFILEVMVQYYYFLYQHSQGGNP
jgi:hypothetical protein